MAETKFSRREFKEEKEISIKQLNLQIDRIDEAAQNITRIEQFIELYVPIVVQKILRPTLGACLPES